MNNSIRMKALATAFVIAGSSLSAFASDYTFSESVTIDEVNYSLDMTQGVARFDGYVYGQNPTTAVVPSRISYEGRQYTVVATGEYSFYYGDYETITLPNTLKEIGAYTFQSCMRLTSITLPSGITELGEQAFGYCTSLTSVAIPNGVKVLHSNLFYGCERLSDVQIPASVDSVGYGVFSSCPSLEELCFTNPSLRFTRDSDPFHYDLKYLHLANVTPPDVDFYHTQMTVYVPQGSIHAYSLDACWMNSVIVDGEQGISVSVNVTPGTLKDQIISKTSYFSNVNRLTIKGKLNDEDIAFLRDRDLMHNLIALDMKEVDMPTIPSQLMYERYGLQEFAFPGNTTGIEPNAFTYNYNLRSVTFPETLTYIGSSAFNLCRSLKSLTFPSSLKTIETTAFCDCGALTSIQFNEGLTSIGSSAFSCSSYPSKITSLQFPSSLKTIGSTAFAYQRSLQSIQFAEGLEVMDSNCFYECNALTEVTIPSSVCYMETPFYYCASLRKVTCLAGLPPQTSGYHPFSIEQPDQVLLQVPDFALSAYKTANGWEGIENIEGIDYMPATLNFISEGKLSLTSVPADVKPVVNIFKNPVSWQTMYGHATISAPQTFSLSGLNMSWDIYDDSNNDYYYYTYGTTNGNNYFGTLISESPIRSDQVALSVRMQPYVWNFICLPFDVRVSDIQCPGVAGLAIRQYSGKNRAEERLSETWLDMTADSILHRGVGYILQYGSSTTATLVFPALNNSHKNDIFTSTDVTLPLQAYPAEFSHNRGWNFVGNPYPCYYDTRYLGFDGIITVWSSYYRNYFAYSVADDQYVLRPGEAFFLQSSVGQNSLTFDAAGRQSDRVAAEVPSKPAAAAADRKVIDLTVSQDDKFDRTRIVFNEYASSAYETTCDATKFWSSRNDLPQLYTVASGVQYAINERPLSDGTVQLGFRAQLPGEYTLSLQAAAGMEIWLSDALTGDEINLTEAGSYTFRSAGQEQSANRFKIGVVGAQTAIEDVTAPDGQTQRYTLDGRIMGIEADGIHIERKNGKSAIVR